MTRDLGAARDEQLAKLAAQGDAVAFGELVRRALPAVRSLLRRMGAQPALADDMTQDAFLAAFRHVAGFRADGPFAAWVGRIAARHYLRTLQRSRREVLAVVPHESLPEPGASHDTAGHIDLDRALEGLSEGERLCVTLCHGAGFTHEELARELAMPLGTVKSLVLRGTLKLRRRLGEALESKHESV